MEPEGKGGGNNAEGGERRRKRALGGEGREVERDRKSGRVGKKKDGTEGRDRRQWDNHNEKERII